MARWKKTWFGYLASALQHVHECNIRHGDIKPSNILVQGSTLILADFGSSKPLEDCTFGFQPEFDFTPQYAAPEVFHGERDKPADVFALGCVFLELCTWLLSSRGVYWKSVSHEMRETRHRSVLAKCWPMGWIKQWRQVQSRTSLQYPELDICEAMLQSRQEMRLTAAEVLGLVQACTAEKLEPRMRLVKNPKMCWEGAGPEYQVSAIRTASSHSSSLDDDTAATSSVLSSEREPLINQYPGPQKKPKKFVAIDINHISLERSRQGLLNLALRESLLKSLSSPLNSYLTEFDPLMAFFVTGERSDRPHAPATACTEAEELFQDNDQSSIGLRHPPKLTPLATNDVEKRTEPLMQTSNATDRLKSKCSHANGDSPTVSYNFDRSPALVRR